MKLGLRQVDEAAANLLKLRGRDTDVAGQPLALGVIVGTGFGCIRSDGVTVIPIGALRPLAEWPRDPVDRVDRVDRLTFLAYPHGGTGTRSLTPSSGPASRGGPEMGVESADGGRSGSPTSLGTWFCAARGLGSWGRPGSRPVPVWGRGFAGREPQAASRRPRAAGRGHGAGGTGRGARAGGHGVATVAPGAAEAIGPATRREVGDARRLVWKDPVELGDVTRIRRTRHPAGATSEHESE